MRTIVPLQLGQFGLDGVKAMKAAAMAIALARAMASIPAIKSWRKLLSAPSVWRSLAPALLVAIPLEACTLAWREGPIDAKDEPAWNGDKAFLTRDGLELQVTHWPVRTGSQPTAVVIALHGVNDHGGRFNNPATNWSDRGILVYAYDQRGFGEQAREDRWPGTEALINDLIDFTTLVAGRHPGVPIVLLGESMGGAIVLSAMGGSKLPPEVKRAVLVAPAVRGRRALGPFRSGGLWLLAHLIPGFEPSTKEETAKLSTDKTLTRTLIADPGYRKHIRIDSVFGLVELMDQAVEAAPQLDRPVLVFYGGKDNLVPVSSVRRALSRMPQDLTLNCFRPYSGHLLFHEKLTGDGGRPALSPEPVWHAAANWMITEERPEICK